MDQIQGASPTLSIMATTPDIPVYIKASNTQLVMEYREGPHEVVMDNKKSGNCTYQQWLVTYSGIRGYVYIENVDANSVLTAGDNQRDPVYLKEKESGSDKHQLWILSAPDMGTNPNFVLMNAKSGMVMDVRGASTSPNAVVQIYERHNHENQQFSFET